MTTRHAEMVRSFMDSANQNVPDTPTVPTVSVCELRAKLILEEALEVIDALGFEVYANDSGVSVRARSGGERKLVNIVKEFCDLSVVTIGGLLACGVHGDTLLKVLEIVDASNLSKFAEGYEVRGDGKIIKSPYYRQPYSEIGQVLCRRAGVSKD